MDFSWTEEQLAFRDSIIRFCRNELSSDPGERDASGTFSPEDWRKLARFGFQGLNLPKKYGGSEADVLTMILAMETLGYACHDNGLIFSLNAQMWSVQHPLVRFGTEEQKQRYLPGLCDGSLIGAHGMSEPGSGSDAFSLGTTAICDGDVWRLNGSKTFTTNGPVADVFVVFATTNKALRFAGLCAFLVDRDTPGLIVGNPLHKMGLRTSPMGELFLDDCVVPAENLLGPANCGMAVFNTSMDRERGLIMASSVGTMERTLERSLEYARQRRQFGQSIGKFQAVSHRLVEMKLRLETARLLLYRLGWLADQGRPTAVEAALVKLHLSESFVQSSMDAVQVHGGYGYMAEYEVERELRDALGSRLYSGTSDIQRNVVARHLKL